MAVCATCRQPGIHPTDHQCPGPQYDSIVFTRHRGRGITIDHAPTHTRLDPRVLADRNTYLRLPEPDVIVFADQVVYRITGFEDGWLLLELIEDWRPKTPTEETKTMPACTATIEGPHVPGDQPIQCTREAGHTENHVGQNPDGDGRTLWTDHTAGAIPHGAARQEQSGD